jgi:hypothetical protein
MAYTSHGHHIPGTIKGSEPTEIKRCGGLINCKVCKNEADLAVTIARVVGERGNFQDRFIRLVRLHAERTYRQSHGGEAPEPFDVFVVWFSKTLQNAKALLGTTLPDNTYYELTYDGDKQVTYFDVYAKVDNFTINDEN